MTIELGVVEEKEFVNDMTKGDSIKGRLVCCKRCGYRFFLSEANEKWYRDRGMEPPKKCFNCRRKDNEKM